MLGRQVSNLYFPKPEAVSENRSVRVISSIAALVLAVFLGIAVWVAHSVAARSAHGSPPSPEEQAYRAKILITDPHLSEAENFAGGTVTYLDAQIINSGPQRVREIGLTLEFFDALHQVVLRQKERLFSVRTNPLGPGESRPLHVTFEHVPPDWNRAVPTVTVTEVRF
jgi:hypothetical protein